LHEFWHEVFGMNGCEEVREILVAVARGEVVSAPGQRFLREHVEACAQCRGRLANERTLSAGLSAMAAAQADTPSGAVRTALLAEFRRQHVVVPIRPPVWKLLRWIPVAAVAAALLLAVFMAKERRQGKVVAPVQVQVKTEPPPAFAPVVAAATGPAKAHPARPHVRRRVVAAPVPARQVEEPAEVATDFFEIPYAEPLRPEERADVFRIQMPRAGMAAFGLPVSGGRLDVRITADVLMGEDGVARAIRFIR
jgi:hypothetical protein